MTAMYYRNSQNNPFIWIALETERIELVLRIIETLFLCVYISRSGSFIPVPHAKIHITYPQSEVEPAK